MKNIYVINSLIAACIIIIISLLTLYKWDLIEFEILENTYVKVAITTIIVIFLILYVGYSSGTKPLYLIGFSVLLELIGDWWLESGIGYIFIIAGIGLLIASFVKIIKKDSWYGL